MLPADPLAAAATRVCIPEPATQRLPTRHRCLWKPSRNPSAPHRDLIAGGRVTTLTLDTGKATLKRFEEAAALHCLKIH